jgi:type III restriction enzyme
MMKDWQVLYESWKDAGAVVPPVMITVANRTETAARIKYAFDHSRVPVPELCDPNLTIHIDSKTMEAAADVVAPETDDESGAKLSKVDAAAILRETVDTVGQKGKRGEQIRNVISVGIGSSFLAGLFFYPLP